MKQLLALIALSAAATLSLAQTAAPAPAEKPATAQQNRMVTCNKEAGDMKGAERKKFMSECLKK